MRTFTTLIISIFIGICTVSVVQAADSTYVPTHFGWYRVIRPTVLKVGTSVRAPATGVLQAAELVKLLRKPAADIAQVQSESGKQGYIPLDDIRPVATAYINSSAASSRTSLPRSAKPIEPVFPSSSSVSSSVVSSPASFVSSKTSASLVISSISSASLAPRLAPQSSKNDAGNSQDAVGSASSLYRVTSTQLHLRMDSRVASMNLRTLKKGDILTILEFLKNGWAKAKTADGKGGFVHAGFLEKVQGN